MLKQLFISVLAICFVSDFFAQVSQANLDVNNLSVKAISPGRIFRRLGNDLMGSNMPSDNDATCVYDINFWLGGKTTDDQLKVVAGTFVSPWSAGTLTINGTATLNPGVEFQYDLIWEISRTQVETHIAYFESLENGTVNQEFPNGYTIPTVILYWPAHGNTQNNESYYLAPFYDYNSDGIYTPELGDFPMFCGDECLYFIINDQASNVTSNIPFGCEVHGMLYAFNSANSPMLRNTVFLKYTIINRSNIALHDAYFSTWMDLDIGSSIDDFVGTNVERSAIYSYNGDSFDEPTSSSSGYGSDLPMFGMTYLRGLKADDDGFDNPLPDSEYSEVSNSYGPNSYGYGDGINDNEYFGLTTSLYHNIGNNPINGDPITPQDYYLFMQGLYLNGDQQYYGADGIVSNYVYPGDSDPLLFATGDPVLNNFDEISLNQLPGDRRIIGSCGPVTIEAGETNVVDLAFVFAQTSEDINIPLETLFNVRLKQAKTYYNTFLANSNCSENMPLSITENDLKAVEISVFPNPTEGPLNVHLLAREKNNPARIIDMSGKIIQELNLVNGINQLDMSMLSSGIYVLKCNEQSIRFVIR